LPAALSQFGGKMKKTAKKPVAYGPHLFLDCYRANPRRLADVGFIFRFLDQLPQLIGMQKIGPPQLCRFTEPDIAGVSGVVMIVTSHISIHTYPLRRCFFMDVFSCKAFDRAFVEEHVRRAFGVGRMASKCIMRGRQFSARNSVAKFVRRGQS
jgi:S-adenosylmethionine decarboxylase